MVHTCYPGAAAPPPDVAANPVPEVPFPRFRETLSKLPPFFRDSDLSFRFRAFYFNRQDDNGTASEVWGLGGWLQYASGWLFDEGLVLTTLAVTPIKGLKIYTGNYYAVDVFDTAFRKAEYTHDFSKDLKLQVGLPYTDQRSVGDKRVGDFTTCRPAAHQGSAETHLARRRDRRHRSSAPQRRC